MRKIGVIGLGKLGLCLAALFAKKFKVCGMDISAERIKQVSRGEDLFEPSLNEYLDKYRNNLSFSTDFESLKDCDPVFIITQTPSLASGKFDLQYVESALRGYMMSTAPAWLSSPAQSMLATQENSRSYTRRSPIIRNS